MILTMTKKQLLLLIKICHSKDLKMGAYTSKIELTQEEVTELKMLIADGLR